MMVITPYDENRLKSYINNFCHILDEKDTLEDIVIKSSLIGDSEKIYEITIKEIQTDEYSSYKQKVIEFRNNRFNWINSNITKQYTSSHNQSFSYYSRKVFQCDEMKHYFFFRVNPTFNVDNDKSNLELLKENISYIGKNVTLCEDKETIIEDYDILISMGKRKYNKLKLGVVFLKDKDDYPFIKLSQDIKCSNLYTFGENDE